MKKVIRNCCLWTVKLLLCLVVFSGSSCISLKPSNNKTIETSKPSIQVVVDESELPSFIQRMQIIKLIPIDCQQRTPNIPSTNTKEFWITFRFVTNKDFLMGRSEIMATGYVSRIIYKYRE